MIKLMRILMFASIGILVLAVLSGYFLPRTWHAQASRTIAAPPAVVHALVEAPRTWPGWVPWSKTFDDSLMTTFEGPERGVGAVFAWSGTKGLGSARLTLVECQPSQGIAYDLVIAGAEYPTRGRIALEAVGAGTQVTWSDGGQLGTSPIPRLFRPMMETNLARTFSEALERLEKLAMQPPK